MSSKRQSWSNDKKTEILSSYLIIKYLILILNIFVRFLKQLILSNFFVKVLIFLVQQDLMLFLNDQQFHGDQIIQLEDKTFQLLINNILVHYQVLILIVKINQMEKMMEFYSVIVVKDFGMLLQIVDIYQDALDVENSIVLNFVRDHEIIPYVVIVQALIMQVIIIILINFFFFLLFHNIIFLYFKLIVNVQYVSSFLMQHPLV